MIIAAYENSYAILVFGSKKVIVDFRENNPSIHYFRESEKKSGEICDEMTVNPKPFGAKGKVEHTVPLLYLHGKMDEEPTHKKSKNHMCKCRSTISGSNNPMYGKHHTEESKRKMREGKKRQWKAQRGSR